MAYLPDDSIAQDRNNALGTVVFLRRYGRTHTRARVVPLNTATPARTRVWNFKKEIATVWRDDMDDNLRREWATAALTDSVCRTRLHSGKLSGWQYFFQVNHTLLNIKNVTIIDPPTRQIPDNLTSAGFHTLDASSQTLSIDATGATGAHTHLICYTSGPKEPDQLSWKGRLTQLQVFAPAAPRPLDISAAWLAKYGTLEGAVRVNAAIRSANDIDGQLGPLLTLTATATGTSDAMVLIQSQVLAANSPTVTFTAIPQTYKHLLLLVTARSSTSATNATTGLTFNNDSAADYDWLRLNAVGGAAGATATPTSSLIGTGPVPAATATANLAGAKEILIQRYSDTNFLKNCLFRDVELYTLGTDGTYNLHTGGGTWRSTAAITRLDISETSGGNFLAGSSFDLYGIS